MNEEVLSGESDGAFSRSKVKDVFERTFQLRPVRWMEVILNWEEKEIHQGVTHTFQNFEPGKNDTFKQVKED